ncbi:hypothetical protein Tco_1380928 [Tanacetum coccineum]
MASGGSDRDAEYTLSRLLQRVISSDLKWPEGKATTLGEAFSLARLIEAHFEAIAEKEKEQIIKKKVDTILSLQNSVFDSGESNVETLRVDEDEPNKVISVLKDGGGEFDDNIDEINLGLREECVIRVLEDKDVSGEKSHEVFSITPWVAKGGRRVLFYVQGNRRWKRKKSIGCSSGRRDCALLGASVFPLFNPGPECYDQVTEGRATQEDQVQARMERGLCHVNLSLEHWESWCHRLVP